MIASIDLKPCHDRRCASSARIVKQRHIVSGLIANGHHIGHGYDAAKITDGVNSLHVYPSSSDLPSSPDTPRERSGA